MKIVYLSYGNIPSRWAHTFQMMRMTEAFAGIVSDVRIVTQRHWSRIGTRFDYQEWYGLARRVNVHHICRRGIPRDRMFRDWKYPGFARYAVQYAKRIGADLIYARLPETAALSVDAGITTILENHGLFEPREIEEVLPRLCQSNLAGIVTINERLKKQYVELGIREDRVLVWPDAVPRERLNTQIDRNAARQRVGLPVDANIVVYTGHLYEYKGIPELIESARLRPKIEFVIVGGWPEDVEKLKAQVREMKNVTVVGFVDNSTAQVYQAAADCLILPNSLRDREQALVTSPLKLFEYMAAQRPIVATLIPALDGLLANGLNAIVVAPDSGRALAEGIDLAVENGSLRSRIVEGAFRDVQKFTWEARARDILQKLTTVF